MRKQPKLSSRCFIVRAISIQILLNYLSCFFHKAPLTILMRLEIGSLASYWFTSYMEVQSYQVTWRGFICLTCRFSFGVPIKVSDWRSSAFSLYPLIQQGHPQMAFQTTAMPMTHNSSSPSSGFISSWIAAHHLKLDLDKKLLNIPRDATPYQTRVISLENSVNYSV